MGRGERVDSLYSYLLLGMQKILNLNPGDSILSGSELEFHCNVDVALGSDLPLLTADE